MSLPREWSLQDSRGSLYWINWPTDPFSSNGNEHPSDDGTGYRGEKAKALPILDHTPAIKSLMASECNTTGSLYSIQSAPMPITENEKSIIDRKNEILQGPICSSGDTFTAGGNATTATSTVPTTISAETTETPRSRPVSLALDTQNYNSKLQTIPHLPSELEEDDNENLLTVSSLTARPLIAKSREIRKNKLTEKKKQRSYSNAPPDGGYGYLIVFGAFSVQFWVAGLVKSYGVLYVEIMETFPNSSAAVASWIPAILSALCLALAPLSSALCQRFSCRTVVFIGGLFCALGLTLSYFATNLIHLLFTFGILTGIGGGLSTTPGIIIVSRYFDKHRALANGICVSGTAAGSFVFPMLIESLVHAFGFHGTILILGGCMLHVCVSATLYRPLEIKESDSSSPATSSTSVNGNNKINNNEITGGSVNNINNSNLSASEDPLNVNRKYLEHLFMEDNFKDKNLEVPLSNVNNIIDYPTDKNIQQEISDEECKDVIGDAIFLKPIRSIRSSSILHSVEDLSTDSTCVYKNLSGYDSNRGSRKNRYKNNFTSDEMTARIPTSINDVFKSEVTKPILTNRGLSKSMIIPTPVSDFSDIFDDPDNRKIKKTCCDKIRRYLDLSLLKNTIFILMCLSVTLMSTGSPYMLFYLPAYVLSIGFTKPEAGYLVAISAALDLFGRLAFGYLSDLQLFDRKKAYIICILGAGIAVLTIPSANSFVFMGLAAGTYGLCLGSWYLLVPVLLTDLFGTEHISSSYGLVRMFQSIGAISVPPLAGYLRDLTGNYSICFYCMGTCMVLGSIPLMIPTFFQKYLNNNDVEENDENVS